MVAPGDVELLELVSRRAELLAALDDPSHKPGLTAAVPASRSTVDRALRELETRSLVERCEGGYRTTLAGELARAEHGNLTATLGDALAARELLSYLPPDAPMSPAFLRGAEVTYPEPPAPRRPLVELWERVEVADHLRGFTTAVLAPRFVEAMHDLVSGGDIRVEFVYGEPLATHLRAEYGELLVETLGDGHRMYVAEPVPFGLGVLTGTRGEYAYVAVSDARGEFRGIAVNDTPAAVDWAATLFERHRNQATELSRADLRD